MPFTIERNDITHLKVDAIVNAANPELQFGGGVCGAIFKAAGVRELQKACDEIGGCKTGEAVITPGFALKAKYIIHTPGPVWQGGNRGEEALLRGCYRNSLLRAVENGCRSVAFPLISSGIYGYPKGAALEVAESEIRAFLDAHEAEDMDVRLIVFGTDAFRESLARFGDISAFVDDHYVRPIEKAEKRRRRGARGNEPLCELSDSLPPKEMAPEDLLESLRSTLETRHEESFSETVLRIIDEKGIKKDSLVYKKANLERSLFSRLRSNRDYHPNKPTALALALALELDEDTMRDLLARAGYALSPTNLTDVIVLYFVRKGCYDIFTVNNALFLYGEPCLGTKTA